MGSGVQRPHRNRGVSRLLGWNVAVCGSVALGILTNPLRAQPTGVLAKLEQDISYIVETVKPCVVTVTGSLQNAVSTGGEPNTAAQQLGVAPQLAESTYTAQLSRVGSGVVYDTAGHIITGSSVVLEADRIWVSFVDGRRREAQYVGCDVQTGIAVIRVTGEQVQPATLSKRGLKPGSWVTIVGNSLGVSPSVSLGLVNGIRPDGLVQVSANLNPGLTGSPAFDWQGHLVGIVLATVAAQPGDDPLADEIFSGTALLCPIDVVRSAVEMILSRRVRPRGWIGLTVEREDGPVPGARVVSVAANSPAELAGIRPGDLIVRVGTRRTQGIMELLAHLTDAEPGEVLDFTILRGDRTVRALVEVMEPPHGGDFHVEVESGCGTTLPTRHTSPTYGYRAPNRGIPSREELEKKIQSLERELRNLKSRLK